MSDSRRVAVVGLGTMGAGIAEVFARNGWDVAGIEVAEAALDRGRAILGRSTDRAVATGKLTAHDRDALLGRVSFGTDLAAVADADVVVEAVVEDLDVKTTIFAELDRRTRPEALLATNTSSLSITAIAASTERPERVVGVHFFNPAPVQPLVELISTMLTSPATVERAQHVLDDLGKTTITCTDRAGFVVNTLLVGYLNRAALLCGDGFAARDEIDAAMVRAGHPMGPLALLDLVGHDVTLAVLNRMYDETRDRLVAPAPLLSQLVAAGWLGRKSGRGFYSYGPEGPTDAPGPGPLARASRAAELPMALLAPYLNRALVMVGSWYASPDQIDTGMSLGCRMPKPFDVLAELGPREVLAAQQQIFAETAEPGDRPALLLERLAAADDPDTALVALREVL
ncbi:MAG TPA: 3-hydroxybutyryl-CoA dehydrogenase [Microlunatus sp.]|nr:3-hydroxybutyryl-CoA dehydrogenase [Microlunatus sp.]